MFYANNDIKHCQYLLLRLYRINLVEKIIGHNQFLLILVKKLLFSNPWCNSQRFVGKNKNLS